MMTLHVNLTRLEKENHIEVLPPSDRPVDMTVGHLLDW